jgi:hypothetical protein
MLFYKKINQEKGPRLQRNGKAHDLNKFFLAKN